MKMKLTSSLSLPQVQEEPHKVKKHCEVKLKSHENKSIKTLNIKRYTKLKIEKNCRPGPCLYGPCELDLR